MRPRRPCRPAWPACMIGGQPPFTCMASDIARSNVTRARWAEDGARPFARRPGVVRDDAVLAVERAVDLANHAVGAKAALRRSRGAASTAQATPPGPQRSRPRTASCRAARPRRGAPPGQDLEDDASLVEPPVARCRLHHGVLAGDIIPGVLPPDWRHAVSATGRDHYVWIVMR